MDHADISAITLVYFDQSPSPSPPPPSPPSPPSPLYGSLSYRHIAMPDFPDTIGKEVDFEEGHIPKFNEALVGSQELEDSIPDNDFIEKCASKQGLHLLSTSDWLMPTDRENMKERMIRENCAFLSRWDDIGK